VTIGLHVEKIRRGIGQEEKGLVIVKGIEETRAREKGGLRRPTLNKQNENQKNGAQKG